MNRFLNLFFSLPLLLMLVGPSAADEKSQNQIVQQKRELEQIRQEVEESQKRLDSLRNLQLGVQKQVSEYDQKLASDRKVIGRLSRELDRLKKDQSEAETQLAANEDAFNRTQRRYLGNIRQFYLSMRRVESQLDYNPNRELQRHREVVYLTALAEFESGNVDEAWRNVDESATELAGLADQRNEVRGLKKQKEVSYSLDQSRKSKQEKNLDQLRRESLDEAERVMTLKMAAEEMERIIVRLEEEREQARLAAGIEMGPSIFAGLKGQLRTPFRGKIVVPFGNLEDPITHLKSFSPGITIQGQSGVGVYSVASGTVAYTGELRGYGNFVIINHDNQYYTTYAGLGRILVSQGQHLPTGTKLAGAGDDGLVKFELRKGREPLDPVTWIRFESL